MHCNRAVDHNLELPAKAAYAPKLETPSKAFNNKRDTPQSMSSALRRPFAHRRGLIIVATLATAYVASHFFRAANVTIGLDLMRDLAIGPEALGALTGAFFFGFSAMQIPCGVLFDHFGPRQIGRAHV